jgi:amino acid transporter
VTGQLGMMFPGEGSIYLWTHKAFGAFWGFFAGFDTVFVLYGVAIALMLIAGIVHLARGRQAEVDPSVFSAWAPSRSSGINFTNWTFFGPVILALLGVEVPLNLGVEIRRTRSITRYLFRGSITARLIFVSGLDRRLPKVMSHVNANKVADVDVLIILRRYAARFEARRLAHPAVFWVCPVIGALAALIGIVSTLSGSWTPLIPNDARNLSVLGAQISYGAWFWRVGGIALTSMVVGALLYLLGGRTAASAAPTGAVPAAGPGT